jgi:hypothetical protein
VNDGEEKRMKGEKKEEGEIKEGTICCHIFPKI